MRTRLWRTPAGVMAAGALVAAGSLTAWANPSPRQEALPVALPAPTDPAPGSPVTGSIYSPDLETSPGGSAGYPRAVVLKHGPKEKGTILAAFAERGLSDAGTMPVYASTDGGKTWEQRSVVASTVEGWTIEAPALFEVPRSGKGLVAGDLLTAGTAWVPGDYTQQRVQVFVSRDQGFTWDYLSDCTSTKDEPNTWGHGIWEPYFVMDDESRLGCFISDERPSKTPTNSQVISHYLSNDGGNSWSSEKTLDVAFPNDPLRRPGMQEIVKLPNGTYVLSYELCRDATDANHACEVYVKHSPDPFDWSPIDYKGELVTTTDQRHLLHTPSIAWFPEGGPLGTLTMTGQRVVNGPTGNKIVTPESGRVMFTNTFGGHGTWTEVTTPVVVDPTGGYGPDVPSCPGYSTPIVPTGPDRYLYLAATWLRTGNQCQVKFGLSALPVQQGSLYGPGGESRCMDVAANVSGNGNAISIWDCGVAEGQRFKLMDNGQLEAIGRCLNPVDGGVTPGTSLELRDCSWTMGQSWTMNDNGTIQHAASDLCIASPDGRNGTQLQLAACTGAKNQTWRWGRPS